MPPAARPDDFSITPYYDDGYEDRQDEIEAALDRLSTGADVVFDDLRRLERLRTDGTPGVGAVVFAADPGSVPDRIDPPTVWVTPDPDAAGD